MGDRSWRLCLCVIASVAWSVAASGCGDDTPGVGGGSAGTRGPGGVGGAMTGAGGTAGTGAVAGVAGSDVAPTECPAPVDSAPAVIVPLLAEDPPVIDGGGPLVDGVYHMTASYWYSGADGPATSNYGSYKDTLVIAHAATGIARVTEVVVGATQIIQRFTMRSAGSTLEVSDSCPTFEYAKYSYSYAAAGATLSILGATRLVVYTRQD